jgi:hypothetical protein
MITEKELIGKSLSLILVSDEGETIVVTGVIQHDGKQLVFQNNIEGILISLPDDTLQRIKVVKEEVRAILNNADFALTLSVGNLPDHLPVDGMIPTGLKWPKAK